MIKIAFSTQIIKLFLRKGLKNGSQPESPQGSALGRDGYPGSAPIRWLSSLYLSSLGQSPGSIRMK